jgi:hypothetical protein
MDTKMDLDKYFYSILNLCSSNTMIKSRAKIVLILLIYTYLFELNGLFL